jgi:hypothetical protein
VKVVKTIVNGAIVTTFIKFETNREKGKGRVQFDEPQQNIGIGIQHFGGRPLLDERLHGKVENSRSVLFGLELKLAEIVDEAVKKFGLEQLSGAIGSKSKKIRNG